MEQTAERQAPKRCFLIGSALSFGWETLKRNFWFFVVLLAFALIVQIVMGAAGEAAEGFGPVVVGLVFLISWIVAIMIGMGLLWIALEFCDDREPTFADLAMPARHFVSFAVASILYGALVLVGTMLFIVPGVYFALKYWPYRYIIVDRGAGPLEALGEAGRLTRGVKWQLLGFFAVLVLINLLGVLFFGIGLLISIPISMLAGAYVYRVLLSGEEPIAVTNPTPSVEEKYGL